MLHLVRGDSLNVAAENISAVGIFSALSLGRSVQVPIIVDLGAILLVALARSVPNIIAIEAVVVGCPRVLQDHNMD